MPSGKNNPDFYDQPPGVGKLLIPSDCFFLKNLFLQEGGTMQY